MIDDFFDSFKGKPKYDHKVRVVHFKKEPFDIYIGRLPNGKYNKWAYPKELRESFPEGTPRKTIVDAYEQYLLSNKDLMNDLHELKDKVLVVGVVLKKLVNYKKLIYFRFHKY